jgi:hypothetical protein
MAGWDRAGRPAEGHGKLFMINEHVGPAGGVNTKRWPFQVAVETADCIAVPGEGYSVANTTAIDISGGLGGMLGGIVGGVGLCGTGPLVGTANRK